MPQMTTRGQQRHWLEEAASSQIGGGSTELSPDPALRSDLALGWFFGPVVESLANTEISEPKWVSSAYPKPQHWGIIGSQPGLLNKV